MTGESKKTTMTIPHQNPASTSANNPTKPLKRILKHHKSSYRPDHARHSHGVLTMELWTGNTALVTKKLPISRKLRSGDGGIRTLEGASSLTP